VTITERTPNGTTTVPLSTRTNTSVSAPAGVQNGDVIEFDFTFGGSTSITVTAPGNVDLMGSTVYSASDPWFVIVAKYLTVYNSSTNPGPWTWTHASRSSQAFAKCWVGVDNTTPQDAAAQTDTSAAGNRPGGAVAPSITTVTPGALVTIVRGSWDGNPISPPAGVTEDYDAQVMWVGHKTQASAGATGTITVADGNSGVSRWGIVMGALRPAGSGQSASLTPAAETDSAQALGRSKARALTVATETDAAQTLGRKKAKSLAAAAETDTAQALTHAKARTLTAAAETDAAQSLVRVKAKSLTPATETDAAVILTPVRRRTLTPATETDAARPPGRTKARSLTPAVETDTAVALTGGTAGVTYLDLTPAAETDSAVALIRVKARTLTPATETDAAVPLSGGTAGVIALTLTPATETDSAVTLRRVKAKSLTPAIETDTAVALRRVHVHTLVAATETDTAVALRRVKAITLIPAAELNIAVALSGTGRDVVILYVEDRSRTVAILERPQRAVTITDRSR